MSADVLVSCEGLTRAHGTRTLFDGITFGLFAGDRTGLVGPNGSGKSTLLRIVAGLELPDSGSISRKRFLRVGHVPQTPDLPLDDTAEQVITSGLLEIGLDEHEILGRVAASLGRAGFEDPSVRVGTLSGGWRKRLAIARELAKEPELLLLDEPTNHLDVEGILWLEELLPSERRACFIVSHDRWFLENVATRMMELAKTWPDGLFATEGDYADFLERRDEAMRGQESYQSSLQNIVRREIEWLRRGPKARTTKSQARIKQAGRLQQELAEVKGRNAKATASIDFTSSERRSKRVLAAEGVTKSLGGRVILKDIDLSLVNGTRLGIIGSNGSGKTTLLRLMAGELEPDTGNITRATNLRVVRFEQDRESLDPSLSLQRALAPEGDAVTFRGEQVHVSSWAKRFMFRAEQLPVQVGRLSGGEQARILIARLMLRPADLLLLDEPTNDLDIATLEVLEESLTEFPGALVLVTHDRYMLDRVATTLASIEEDGRLVTYADLAQWQAAHGKGAVPSTPGGKGKGSSAPKDKSAPKDAPQGKERSEGEAPFTKAKPQSQPRGVKALSYKERGEWTAMDGLIVEAEARAERAGQALADPAVARDAGALTKRQAEHEAARAEVDRLYARWAELEAKQSAT